MRPSESSITENVDARDRADTRGEPVEPVEEVDHVHDGDDPEHGQRHADPRRQRRATPTNGNVKLCDPDAEAGRDRGGEHLPAELLPPGEAAEVVDRADRRRDRRAEQDAAHPAAERQERERRARGCRGRARARRAAGSRAVARRASRGARRARGARQPADRRRQQQRRSPAPQRAPQTTSRWSSAESQTISAVLLRAVEAVSRVARGPGRCSRSRSGRGRSRRRRSARRDAASMDALDPLRRGDDRDQPNARRAASFTSFDRVRGRVAGREHRVEQDHVALARRRPAASRSTRPAAASPRRGTGR